MQDFKNDHQFVRLLANCQQLALSVHFKAFKKMEMSSKKVLALRHLCYVTNSDGLPIIGRNPVGDVGHHYVDWMACT